MSDPIALICQKIRACNPKKGNPNGMMNYESRYIHQILGVIFTLQDEDKKATVCFEALQQQCGSIDFGVNCVFDVRKKLSEHPDWVVHEDTHICDLVQKYVNEQFELLQTRCAKKDVTQLAQWNACLQWVTKLNSWGFKIEVPILTKEEIQQYKNDATFDASLINWKFKALGITQGDTPFLAILDHDETVEPDLYTVCTDGSTIPSQTPKQLSKDAQKLLEMKILCTTEPNWRNTVPLDHWLGVTFDQSGNLVSLWCQMKRGMMVDVSPFEHLEQLNLVSSSLEFIRFGYHPKLHMIDRLMLPDDTTELVLTQKLPSGIKLNGHEMDNIEDAIRVRWEELPLSKDAQALLELKPFCMFEPNWSSKVRVDEWTGTTFDKDGNLTLLCKPFRCDTLDVSSFEHLKVLNQNESEINTIRLGNHPNLENVYRGKAYGFSGPSNLVWTIPPPKHAKLNGILFYESDHVRIHWEFSEAETKEEEPTNFLSKDARELLKLKPFCSFSPNWDETKNMYDWSSVEFNAKGQLILINKCFTTKLLDLSPFEHLETLYLSHYSKNKIDAIKFGNHPNLKKIDVRNNPIQQLCADGLPEDCNIIKSSHTELISNAIGGGGGGGNGYGEALPVLPYISKDACILMDTMKHAFSSPVNWSLELPLDQWSQVKFDSNERLVEFGGFCGHSVSTLDFSPFEKLQVINICGNHITKIIFGKHPDLYHVDVSNTAIQFLNTAGLSDKCNVIVKTGVLVGKSIECST